MDPSIGPLDPASDPIDQGQMSDILDSCVPTLGARLRTTESSRLVQAQEVFHSSEMKPGLRVCCDLSEESSYYPT